MNKQFLFIFNCKIEENYSELIIIKNLNLLIEYILINNNSNQNLNDFKNKINFSITIVNIHYNLNDDSNGEINFKCKSGKTIDLDNNIK